MTSPRMQIIWDVLPRAIDNEDWTVIEACRRLIVANRLGWRRYTNATDWNLVLAFADDEKPSPTDSLTNHLDQQEI